MRHKLINKLKRTTKDNHPHKYKIVKRTINKKSAEELINERTNQLIKLKKETNIQTAKKRTTGKIMGIYRIS
jgi:endonuclease V-like protein UPF0215 family